MAMEIEVHKSLDHKHVVKFIGFFEDKDNIYVLLELCRRRSLMELHKRRKALTEPEVRYLMYQILLGVEYLHKNKIIHRDLKLGNLFLNDDMEIKIGDFGLATRVEVEGERKRTLCGTPNYIAPEVLNKKGHSYEVDVWSVGCVLYTLLVGKPPFETQSLKDTYARIRRNEYHIPPKVSESAKIFIRRLLRLNPSERPTMSEVLCDPFFSAGYMPLRLPTSCLSMAPHFKKAPSIAPAPKGEVLSRKPLAEMNPITPMDVDHGPVKGGAVAHPLSVATPSSDDMPSDWHLHQLQNQLARVLKSDPSNTELKPPRNYDEAEDPAITPVFWISKWVDYSDKYGLGYQLCDTSVGVLFNDSTRLILGADGESVQYIDRHSTEEFYTLSSYPDTLAKKITLLTYFRSYMSEHLLKAGGKAGERPLEDGTRLPHLRAWFRTRSAIVLHLSNGTLQINFFQDHTKVIICPIMQAVSYIDEAKNLTTYKLSMIEKHGCIRPLVSRLKYAKSMVEKLLEKLPQPPCTSEQHHPLGPKVAV
jgi:polo-like kinase 1